MAPFSIMHIHKNNTIDQKAAWLTQQLTPGQVIRASTEWKQVGFLLPDADKITPFNGDHWVMFLSPETSLRNEIYISVLHDGRVYYTSIFNFIDWFDSQGILPECWKDEITGE